MPKPKNLMLDLQVRKISLVPAGADDEAHIKIFKSKGGGTIMKFAEILAKMKPEHQAVIQAEIEKAKGEMPEEAKKKLEEAKDDAIKKQKEAEKALQDMKDEVAKGKPSDEDVLKGLDPAVRSIVEKAQLQAKAAEQAVQKMKDEQDGRDAIAKAKEVEHIGSSTEDIADIYKSLNKVDATLCGKVFDVLKTADEVIAKGAAFKELGDSHKGEVTTVEKAWEAIEKAAEEVAKGKSINTTAAISEVIKCRPELYDAYIKAQQAE